MCGVTIEELLGIDGDALRPPPGWTNGWGATFGGYVAAVLLHALERAMPAGQAIATAQVSFVQPLRAEPDAHLAVAVHRSGRSATSASASLVQDGMTVAVATGWATALIDQPARLDIAAPEAGPPAEYAPGAGGDAALTFVDRDFDMRVVPTGAGEPHTVQWMRLKRLDLSDGAPWPAGAVGLVADMVGAGPYHAAVLATGAVHHVLALDLTIHLAGAPRGPWVLGDFDNVSLVRGRAIGRGDLFDADGTFVARITQQSLVRPVR
jgi:acyl-CoA thioesterase